MGKEEGGRGEERVRGRRRRGKRGGWESRCADRQLLRLEERDRCSGEKAFLIKNTNESESDSKIAIVGLNQLDGKIQPRQHLEIAWPP